MVRPKHCRRIASLPGSSLFKPAGIPACSLGQVVLAVDEFEALRLADYEALYQEQAAERMRISRQTFGRIVETARKKVAQALVEGLVLRIEGGEIEMAKMQTFDRCRAASVPQLDDVLGLRQKKGSLALSLKPEISVRSPASGSRLAKLANQATPGSWRNPSQNIHIGSCPPNNAPTMAKFKSTWTFAPLLDTFPLLISQME